MKKIILLSLFLWPLLAIGQNKIDSIPKLTEIDTMTRFPTIHGSPGAKVWKYFTGKEVRTFTAADIITRAYVPDTTGSHSVENDYGNFVRSVDGNVYYCNYSGSCKMVYFNIDTSVFAKKTDIQNNSTSSVSRDQVENIIETKNTGGYLRNWAATRWQKKDQLKHIIMFGNSNVDASSNLFKFFEKLMERRYPSGGPGWVMMKSAERGMNYDTTLSDISWSYPQSSLALEGRSLDGWGRDMPAGAAFSINVTKDSLLNAQRENYTAKTDSVVFIFYDNSGGSQVFLSSSNPYKDTVYTSISGYNRIALDQGSFDLHDVNIKVLSGQITYMTVQMKAKLNRPGILISRIAHSGGTASDLIGWDPLGTYGADRLPITIEDIKYQLSGMSPDMMIFNLGTNNGNNNEAAVVALDTLISKYLQAFPNKKIQVVILSTPAKTVPYTTAERDSLSKRDSLYFNLALKYEGRFGSMFDIFGEKLPNNERGFFNAADIDPDNPHYTDAGSYYIAKFLVEDVLKEDLISASYDELAIGAFDDSIRIMAQNLKIEIDGHDALEFISPQGNPINQNLLSKINLYGTGNGGKQLKNINGYTYFEHHKNYKKVIWPNPGSNSYPWDSNGNFGVTFGLSEGLKNHDYFHWIYVTDSINTAALDLRSPVGWPSGRAAGYEGTVVKITNHQTTSWPDDRFQIDAGNSYIHTGSGWSGTFELRRNQSVELLLINYDRDPGDGLGPGLRWFVINDKIINTSIFNENPIRGTIMMGNGTGGYSFEKQRKFEEFTISGNRFKSTWPTEISQNEDLVYNCYTGSAGGQITLFLQNEITDSQYSNAEGHTLTVNNINTSSAHQVQVYFQASEFWDGTSWTGSAYVPAGGSYRFIIAEDKELNHPDGSEGTNLRVYLIEKN